MHFPATGSEAEKTAALLEAVKEATRGACHVADASGHFSAGADRAEHAVEAAVRATRALFEFEDALARRSEGPGVLADALVTLQAAEDAIRAAREAIESRLSRTLRPQAPARGPLPP